MSICRKPTKENSGAAWTTVTTAGHLFLFITEEGNSETHGACVSNMETYCACASPRRRQGRYKCPSSSEVDNYPWTQRGRSYLVQGLRCMHLLAYGAAFQEQARPSQVFLFPFPGLWEPGAVCQTFMLYSLPTASWLLACAPEMVQAHMSNVQV